MSSPERTQREVSVKSESAEATEAEGPVLVEGGDDAEKHEGSVDEELVDKKKSIIQMTQQPEAPDHDDIVAALKTDEEILEIHRVLLILYQEIEDTKRMITEKKKEIDTLDPKEENEICEYFDMMINGIDKDLDREASDRLDELVTTYPFKGKITRLLVFLSAKAYQTGSSTYFADLRESLITNMKKKRARELDKLRKDLEFATAGAEVKEFEKKERERLVIEEVTRKKEQERERARAAEELLLKIAAGKSKAEELKAQDANNATLQRLKTTGIDSETPLEIGDEPLFADEPETYIKQEKTDANADLLKKFRDMDDVGKTTIRKQRADMRLDIARRREAGEKGVADLEWIEELDEPYEFEDDDNDKDESTTLENLDQSVSTPTKITWRKSFVSEKGTHGSSSVPAKRRSGDDDNHQTEAKRTTSLSQYNAYSRGRTYQQSSTTDPRRDNGDPRRANGDPRVDNGDPRRDNGDPRRAPIAQAASDPRKINRNPASDPRRRR